MKVLVSGSSGLIGTALRARLATAGHEVVRLVRSAPGPGEVRWDLQARTIDRSALEGIDAVVHLAGAGIGDKRWSEAYKREILDSRVVGTTLLAEALAGMERRPAVLLSGSAIGVYGSRGDEELDEASAPGTGFLADVCTAWEAATAPAEAAGIRVVHLRTGIVLSPAGGALKKQLPLFRFGLGGRFGSGRQWQSWISLDDEIGAIEHLLAAPVSGAVNLTAPAPVTNREFTQTLARVLKRPAFLPVPAFAPKLLLGAELVQNLLLDGQRVLPRRLLDDGYAFAHADLETALRALLRR
jgi:hypothetical protein